MRNLPCFMLVAGMMCSSLAASAQSVLDSNDNLPVASERPAVEKLVVSDPTPVPRGPSLRAANQEWINGLIGKMTLEDKVGQMIMPAYSASSANDYVTTYHVGGFLFNGNGNTAAGLIAATNHLQEITSVPLIFSIDCEAGLGARCVDATRFPMNMGAGSAMRPELVREQGGVTARECRAVGIQIGFGPVLDVNTEPINPIIGIRSYGERPERVAELAGAYVSGANAEGLLCTYKHFPGHGPTTGDSHAGLQTVTISRQDLDNIHLAPYRTLFASGTVDLVMSGHLWYTCLDPGTTPWPATISNNAMTGVLRNELGYTGCVISDSYGMGGLLQAAGNSTYNAARLGVQAGLDIVLSPASIPDAYNGIRDAVIGGQISTSRIDDSVRRILTLKSRAGMPEVTTVSTTAYTGVLKHADNLAVAHEIGSRTITTTSTQAADLPLTSSQSVLVLALATNNTIFYRYDSSSFFGELTAHLPSAVLRSVGTSLSSSAINTLANEALGYDRVIVAAYEWQPALQYSGQVTLVNTLISQGSHVIYCSFGSPYQYMQFPGVPFRCAFSSHYDSQQEMARELVGMTSPSGHWPIAWPTPLSDISTTGSCEPTPAIQGRNVRYTFTVTNSGPDSATDVFFTDVLPDGCVYTSSTASQGSVEVVGGAVVGELGSIEKDATATVSVIVQPAVVGTINNGVVVAASQDDPDTGNNATTVTTMVQPAPVSDLSLTGFCEPTHAMIGTEVYYTFTVTNSGPDRATDVVLTDALPAGCTYTSSTTTQGSVGIEGGAVIGELGSIEKDASATVTVAFRLQAVGNIANGAVVTANQDDPHTADNALTVTAIADPVPASDLLLTGFCEPPHATVGTDLCYTFTVTNPGPDRATDVVFTDALPDGCTYTSSTTSQGIIEVKGGAVVGELGTIEKDASVTVTVVLLPTIAGTVSNSAIVVADQYDPSAANNARTVTAEVVPLLPPSSSLSITGFCDPDPATLGTDVCFTFAVTNFGPDRATGVVFTDVLPNSCAYTSSTTSQGSVDIENGAVHGELGSIEKDASVTVTVVLLPTAVGTISNSAIVVADQDDPDTGDNSTTVTIAVRLGPGPDLSGAWSAVSQRITGSGGRSACTVKGRLMVSNAGDQDAGRSAVQIFLSDTPNVAPGSAPIKSISVAKLKHGKTSTRLLNAKLRAGALASGKYLIAILDAGKAVSESNEFNNKVVWGPLN